MTDSSLTITQIFDALYNLWPSCNSIRYRYSNRRRKGSTPLFSYIIQFQQ